LRAADDLAYGGHAGGRPDLRDSDFCRNEKAVLIHPGGVGPTRTEQCHGFTLLEVVIALAIAGLALAGLFKAGTGGLLAVETAGQLEEAVQRAQSHLASIAGDALVEGETEGNDGGGFRWRLRVVPIAATPSTAAHADENATGGAVSIALFNVEVAIVWKEGGRDRSVVLGTRRLGNVAAK